MENKVYIAFLNIPHGPKRILKVCSTKEKAEEYRKEVKYYDIEEFPEYYEVQEWNIE